MCAKTSYAIYVASSRQLCLYWQLSHKQYVTSQAFLNTLFWIQMVLFPNIVRLSLCDHSGALATIPLSMLKLWFFIIFSLNFRPFSSHPMGTVCCLGHSMDQTCLYTVGSQSMFLSVCFIWKALGSSLPDPLHKRKESTGSGDHWETGFGSWLLAQTKTLV